MTLHKSALGGHFILKNIELKANLLTTGKYDEYKKAKKEYYKNGDITGLNDFGYDDLKACYQLSDSRKKQRQKVQNHLSFMFECQNVDLFFATFTFNDDSMELKDTTRKQQVRRAISDLEDYILNIDYGSENERQHYHAILMIKKGTYEITKKGKIKHKGIFKNYVCIDLLDNKYKLGWYMLEPIRENEKSKKKISNYISKLVMHSVKVQQRYISTKKGSNYQKSKKIEKKTRRMARYEDYRKINSNFDYSDEDFANKII